MNPSKQGKEGRRSFRFNKVYNPTATQGFETTFNLMNLSHCLRVCYFKIICLYFQLKYFQIYSH